MRGIYFFKKTCDNIFFFQYRNKNSYLQDRRRLVSISWTLSRIYFFPISVMVHFRIFSFTSVTIAITSGPSGRVGRLGDRIFVEKACTVVDPEFSKAIAFNLPAFRKPDR